MTVPVPERIAWAVELLDVQPGDRILELGCGPGVAVALVCARLKDGHIVGIDRSPTAIQRAERRRLRRAQFEQVDLAGFDAEEGAFDKAFAVNVNVFWTSDANPESEVLARILRPGGVVHLVYDTPSSRGAPTVAANLSRHGFATSTTTTASLTTTTTLTCITGRLP